MFFWMYLVKLVVMRTTLFKILFSAPLCIQLDLNVVYLKMEGEI